jgi:hypothetical protein
MSKLISKFLRNTPIEIKKRPEYLIKQKFDPFAKVKEFKSIVVFNAYNEAFNLRFNVDNDCTIKKLNDI